MANQKEKLFSDFPPVSTEEWMAKITADLKGAGHGDIVQQGSEAEIRGVGDPQVFGREKFGHGLGVVPTRPRVVPAHAHSVQNRRSAALADEFGTLDPQLSMLFDGRSPVSRHTKERNDNE